MSETTERNRITGTVRPPEFHRFLESPRIDPHHVVNVLRGEVAGCVFRGVIDPTLCRNIAQNFWTHPQRRQRGDNVAAFFLGTFHYRKPLLEYLDEAAVYHDTLHDVFRGCANIFQNVIESVGSLLAKNAIAMRVAAHGGRAASEFVVRSWAGTGAFALEPHEDGAQLQDVQQHGFEIQKVGASPVVAINMCLETPGGGELHYWNIEPDDATRERLGLQDSGYPYPLDALTGFEKLSVPIHSGDVYMFNSKLVHAVAAQATSSGYRSTISSMMGFADPTTVIYWS